MQFSADAYVNEMGITTQSCFGGTQHQRVRDRDRRPTAGPSPTAATTCAPRQPGPNPARPHGDAWAQVDDAVGACTGGRTEIQDDVFLFAVFMTALAPAPRDFSDPSAVTPRRSRCSAGRVRGLPRHDDVPHAREPAPRQHRRGGHGDDPRARQLRLQPVLGLLDPRHGDAGRHDRQCAARRSGEERLVATRGRCARRRCGACGSATTCCTTAAAATSSARCGRTTARRRRRATRSTRSARRTSTTWCSSSVRCGTRATPGRDLPLRGTAGGRGQGMTSGLDRSRFFSRARRRRLLRFFGPVGPVGRARRRCRGRPSSCRASGVTVPAPAPRAP